MDETQPASSPCKVTCYAGYIQLNGTRIELGFEAPVGASREQLDAAFLVALAEHATYDYLAVGEAVVTR